MSGDNRIDHIFLSPNLTALNPTYILPPEFRHRSPRALDGYRVGQSVTLLVCVTDREKHGNGKTLS